MIMYHTQPLFKMKKHTINLPSNTPNSFYENTMNHFFVPLREPLLLDGHWEAGIKMISYTRSFTSISECVLYCLVISNDESVITDLGDRVIERVKLPEHCVGFSHAAICDFRDDESSLIRFNKNDNSEDPQTLVMNLDTKYETLVGFEHHPEISLKDGYLTLRPGMLSKMDKKKKVIVLPHIPDSRLRQQLGLTDNFFNETNCSVLKEISELREDETEISSTFRGTHPVMLENINYNLYVYCDFMRHSVVGNTCAPLLGVIEIPKTSFGDQVSRSFPSPVYYPVAKEEIREVEIEIRFDDGTPVNFDFGKCVITIELVEVE